MGATSLLGHQLLGHGKLLELTKSVLPVQPERQGLASKGLPIKVLLEPIEVLLLTGVTGFAAAYAPSALAMVTV